MKRRGFLGLLLSAPLAPVAAKAAISEKPAIADCSGRMWAPNVSKALRSAFVKAPAFSFANDTSVGLYCPGANTLQFVVASRHVKVPYFDK